jgi:hypothetical protein
MVSLTKALENPKFHTLFNQDNHDLKPSDINLTDA